LSIVLKIRLLLLVLTLSFFATAITIRFTMDQKQVLLQDAKKIEQIIHKKETYIQDFLEDSLRFQSLRNLSSHDARSLELINLFTEKHGILFYTYSNNELDFWSSTQVPPPNDLAVREGTSMPELRNGYYIAHKKSEGTFSSIFLIPIKSEYKKENEYLINAFSEDLLKTNQLDIAKADEPKDYNIRSKKGEYLFSLKVQSSAGNTLYSQLVFLMWILAFFSGILLIHILCQSWANKGHVWSSIFLFGLCLMLIRVLELENNWFAQQFHLEIFQSIHFASSRLFPHLGAFLINVMLCAWWLLYAYINRTKLWIPRLIKHPIGRILGIGLSGSLVIWVAFLIGTTYSGLILHSNIPFDVTNILDLNRLSWLGLLCLCISMLSLVMLIDFIVELHHKLMPLKERRILFQIIFFAICGAILMVFEFITLAFFLLVGLFFLRTWFRYHPKKLNLAVFISTLLLLAGIGSVKHIEYQRLKKMEGQKLAIQKLIEEEDLNALSLFGDLEKDLLTDTLLQNFSHSSSPVVQELLDEYLKKNYFSGYLSKYDISTSIYNDQDQPLFEGTARKRQTYVEMIVSGNAMLKTGNHFYSLPQPFGNFEYFALIPLVKNQEHLGVLLIEMRYRSFSPLATYPEILSDSRVNQEQNENISQYAYALYKNGALVSQFGKYVYPTHDSLYQHIPIHVFQTIGRDKGFAHMAYKPDGDNLVVLSKPQQSFLMQIAAVSFLFLVFLFFAILVHMFRWMIETLDSHDFSLRNLHWSFLILINRTMYSTRIQSFVVLAVVFTLITAGVITYFSISHQFRIQQENNAVKFALEIAKGLEARKLKSPDSVQFNIQNEFDIITEATSVDLNLYNTKGALLYSTQPKIFDLISDYMNPVAWIHLNHLGISEYVDTEKIGGLQYLSAYAPIRNEAYEPIAFVGFPRFSSQSEFDKNIGVLLNTLINIYALVIVILGLFAVFIANKITAPLTLVQRSLARTALGKLNEPIFWKRNDEIGSLIKEYNLMILALEQSTNNMVKSERESAWREMAKQIAHEIKNPLTPLKLGIQQLERSWKDHDPDFEIRFKRFSESFIEQIESLTHIASEFSNFAKMPDTKLEWVDLIDIMYKAVEVFNNSHNVTIQYTVIGGYDKMMIYADRDQLLRAFNNLIKNSIEAAVGKRRCLIKINLIKEGEFVLLEFQDNGQGIPLEVRSRIFQPNFTTKSSGTGLGLAFVKQAIENMGGTITYETSMGKGTTFYIRIPYQETKEFNTQSPEA
jgi:two-component system nitrogen regulation sensor histidine kinase NtrY